MSILTDLNNKIKNNPSIVIRESNIAKKEEVTKDMDAVLANAEEYMESGLGIRMQFEACDPLGNFTHYEEGVLFLLEGKSTSDAFAKTTTYATTEYLNKDMEVVVTKVDREAKTVYLGLSSAEQKKHRFVMKSRLIHEFEEILSVGNKPRVYGRVTKVTPENAYVSILDVGLLGVINVREWQKTYLPTLKAVCNVGDYFEFEVIRKAPKVAGKDTAFMLSRKVFTADAWANIDTTSLIKGSIILVTCTSQQEGKSYWWGASDRVPGVPIMGDYTTRLRRNTGIVNGVTYKCRISELSIKPNGKNVFKVIPYDAIEEDKGLIEHIARIKSPANPPSTDD